MTTTVRGFFCARCGRHSHMEYEVPETGKRVIPLLLLCCGERMMTTANRQEREVLKYQGRKVKR